MIKEQIAIEFVSGIFKTLFETVKDPPTWVREKYQVADPFGLEAKNTLKMSAKPTIQ